jgi:hypothetical protein
MSRSLYDPNYIASAKPRGLLPSRLPTVAVSCILLHFASSAGARADETAVMFNRDIRPILAENCFHCHGPDKNHRKADLRLDDRQTATELGAIVPGEPGSSELIRRIESENPDEQMPPAESGRRLTDEQKNLLQRWIAEGAVYQRHWAYEPPVRPEIVGSGHPIDSLVGKQLSRLSLNPSPEADRRTLIRRLSFDLLGLPPRPEEVDAFVNDSRPDGYEQLVERLLSSPHFGERMAEGWLDVVRYADTIGYHSDNPRSVWPYRDYVINAFNGNKRFDQFEIEQLAGDLLPDNTEEQRVASCFNRLLLTTQEGGAQPKDYEARMLADRVRAIGTVWLGQTFGCCQCHDHKFDPISTRDFYSLGAFFADIDDKPGDPGTALPNADQAPELARLQNEATALRRQYDVALSPQLVAAELAWETAVVAELADTHRWQALKPADLSAANGTKLSSDETGLVSVDAKAAQDADTFVLRVTTPLKVITGLRLDVLPNSDLPQDGPGLGSDGGFTLSEFEVTDAQGQRIPLAHASATKEASGFAAAYAIDGSVDDGRGWSTDVPGAPQAICVELADSISISAESPIVIRLYQAKGSRQLLGRFRISATTASKPVRAPQVVTPPTEIVELIRLQASDRKPDQHTQLVNYFKSQLPELVDLRTRTVAAEHKLADFESGVPHCLLSVSSGKPRTVRIMPRGNWMDESGPIVEPALPAYLPQPKLGGSRRLNRLDLARWIAARENPLTARVFVNRLWKQFFGVGLSKSVDDLGSQGEWPMNPELLDWLACEFMDSGWDVKHMIRVIVTSKTYRQVSTASPDLLAKDLDNRWLDRQNRFRLDAESVRDNALAISGLLVPTIGGPSVKPYQPDGYWENLNFPVRTYEADKGANQYRRGLYTWWQRTFLHPSLLAFDAPSREECAPNRPCSNIPQQALVLLNDPTYVEAARAFAARMILEGGGDPSSRIRWAWRQSLARMPREEELSVTAALFEKHHREFMADPASADRLLHVGQAPLPQEIDAVELAAWTSVARLILNLHETIVRN